MKRGRTRRGTAGEKGIGEEEGGRGGGGEGIEFL